MRKLLLVLLSFPLLMGGCCRFPATYLVNASDSPVAVTSYLHPETPPEQIFNDYDDWESKGISFSDTLHPPLVFWYIGTNRTNYYSRLASPSFCKQYSLENPPLEIAFDSTFQEFRCVCLDTLEDDQIVSTVFIPPGEQVEVFDYAGDISEIRLGWGGHQEGEINRMDLIGKEAFSSLLQPMDGADQWMLEVR